MKEIFGEVEKIVKQAFFNIDTPLQECWNELSRLQRQLLFLRYVCEWTPQEIAGHTGMSSENVYSNTSHALRKIRESKKTKQWRMLNMA